ncbi:ribosome maturation factor RimP [bacterium]|nr:ribosome maturation factor RimP [bacterium]
MADIETKVTDLITPTLDAMGLEIVSLRIHGAGVGQSQLQILLDHTDGTPVTLEDCTQASRSIAMLMEVHDPISSAYVLEISSAGVDRPLTKPSHYPTYIGHEVKMQTQPLDGRSRYRGIICQTTDRMVAVEDGNVCWMIPFAQITESRLVLTDALLKKFRPKAEPKANPWEGKKQSQRGKRDPI